MDLDLQKLQRIVIGVDPAVTNNANSDTTGIIVAAKGLDGFGYILDDLSMKGSPNEWAKEVVRAYHYYKADRIVAEVNQGGDLVQQVIRSIDPYVSYKAVRASKGKVTRAEPIAALYEQKRIYHVKPLEKLEDEMCNWSPAFSSTSPDRVDALVWALTELFIDGNHAPPDIF